MNLTTLKTATSKLTKFIKRSTPMMINFYAMQIENGWITLDQVPKKYRAKVKALVEQANAGLEDNKEE